ncbi:MAG: uracil-DNA glycosylase [Pyrinomonadaceae bacterium]
MNDVFSALLADLKEQILYLQELGVENFDVNLPELDTKFSSVLLIQPSKAEERKPNLERFVPPAPIITPEADRKPESFNQPSTLRQSLLEKSKLSRLPQLSKLEESGTALKSAALGNFQTPQNSEQKNREDMTKSKISNNENPNVSLFGDLKQTLSDSGETLEDIRADIGNCTRCPLWEGRTKIVHSEGNPQAELVFVGEAPGADEDASGRPFVGRAGQLLNKIIEAIGMKREEVFIGNINRCRPPQNRQPTLPEAHTCRPFLMREIAVVKPKVIIVMGNTAMKNLLDTKEGITKLRGEFQDYFGVKVMPTFHPAYLLRDPSKKREVWEDMKKVRDELNK